MRLRWLERAVKDARDRRASRGKNAAEKRNDGALLRAVQGERGEVGCTVFRVDSKYAIHIATGRTRPRSGPKATNRDLHVALRLRDAYRQLQQERREAVRIEHVRSHTGVRGNEAADALAKKGTQIGDRQRDEWS